MQLNRLYLKRLVVVALIGIVLYAVVGFLVLPAYLGGVVENYTREVTGRELKLGKLDVNPFKLTLTVSNAELFDTDQSTIFELERGHVNVDITGLLRRTVVIHELDIQRPQLNLVHYGAGETNLSRLLASFSSQSAEEKEPLALYVKSVNLADGKVQLLDRTGAAELQTSLQQLSFTASDIATQGDSGSYTLAFNDGGAGKLRVTGKVALNSLSSTGKFELAGVDLRTLYPWIKNQVSLGEVIGRLDLHGDYAASAAENMLKLRVSSGRFGLSDLQLQPGEILTVRTREIGIDFDSEIVVADESLQLTSSAMALRMDALELTSFAATVPLLSMEKISLSGGSLDLQNRSIKLSNLSLEGGNAVYTRQQDGQSEWMDIVDKIKTTGSTPGTSDKWVFHSDEVRADHIEMKVIDLGSGEPVELVFGDIEVLVSDLDTAADKRSEFSLTMTVNQSGQLEGKGWLSPADAELEAAIILADLDVMKFNPYLGSVTVLQFGSGLLNADINAQYRNDSFAVDGQVGGRDFAFIDSTTDDPVMTLDEVKVKGVNLKGMPLASSIESITLQKPNVKVQIGADKKLNLSSWFKKPDQEGTQATGVKQEGEEAVSLAIDQIEINDGDIDFSDFSLSSEFEISISDIKGILAGFNLDAKRSASLDLLGRVGEFGSAKITGRLRPLAPAKQSEINMVMRNISTVELSSYSGRFAGRKIESGKLNLDLRYLVKDGKLDGNHEVEFVDLALGERVESPDALDLPLDLAIALLKDSEGRIKIAIPVSGDLENPEFNLSAVISKATGKIISGIVSAPFKLLGSLLGGSDKKLNSIPFDPGSAAIIPPAIETMTGLSQVLEKRPGIALRAVGTYDPDIDRDALARQQLRLHVFLAAGLEPEDPTQPRPVVFSDPKIQEVLDEFALSRLGKEKQTQLAQAGAGQTAAGEAGNAEVDEESYYENIFNELVEAEEIPLLKLERVARYRAQSIADQFERLGVASGRINVGEEIKTTDASDHHVMVELIVEPSR